MKNTGTFIKTIVPADANNIVTLANFNEILAPYKEFEAGSIIEHAIILEDFQVKVGLFSLIESDWPTINALASESAVEAAWAKIKKEGQKIFLGVYHAYGADGPWLKKGEEILQNKNSLEQPWALMAPFFSTNTTALLDEDLRIGVRVESKAEGIGGLKAADYLHLFGSWRKVTNFRKKDDEGGAQISRVVSLNFPPNVPTEIAPARPGANRRGLMIYNRGSSAVYISYGDIVSSSVYTVKISPNDFYENLATKFSWQGTIRALGDGITEGIVNITEFLLN